MSEEQKPAKVVALDTRGTTIVERAPPNQHLIGRLKELLAEAEDGRLRNFVGCGKSIDGWVTNCWAGDVDYERFAVLGGVTLLQSRLARRIDECDG